MSRVANNTFGKWVKERRLAVGLTQQTLGKAIGVRDSYISRIEQGERGAPGTTSLIRMADALETPLSKLMVYAGLLPKCKHPEHLDAALAALEGWKSVMAITEAIRVSEEIVGILDKNLTKVDPSIRHLLKPLQNHIATLRTELRVKITPTPKVVP